jgi:hypothetical protein
MPRLLKNMTTFAAIDGGEDVKEKYYIEQLV